MARVLDARTSDFLLNQYITQEAQSVRQAFLEYLRSRVDSGAVPYLCVVSRGIPKSIHIDIDVRWRLPVSFIERRRIPAIMPPAVIEVCPDETPAVCAAALEKFGKLMMERVRDYAIADWVAVLGDPTHGQETREVAKSLRQFNAEQIDVIRGLIPQIVDTTMHFLMWALEQEEDIDVAVHTEIGTVSSIREISDGLTGELCDWIPAFGKKEFYNELYADPHRFFERALEDHPEPEQAARILEKLAKRGTTAERPTQDRVLSGSQADLHENSASQGAHDSEKPPANKPDADKAT